MRDLILQLSKSSIYSTKPGIVTDNHRRDIENQPVRVDNIISRLEESKKITLDTLEKQRLQETQSALSCGHTLPCVRGSSQQLQILEKPS